MSLQDPIADMLTRVRNAQKASKQNVAMPASKHKARIAAVEKFLGDLNTAMNPKPAEQPAAQPAAAPAEPAPAPAEPKQ